MNNGLPASTAAVRITAAPPAAPFFAVFAAASPDAQAVFAGHLAFVVARGADLSALRAEFQAPLARFAEIVDIDDALSAEETLAALDAFFATHPVEVALARAFEAYAQEHLLADQGRRADGAEHAAHALLSVSSSKVPVGAVRIAGTMAGGPLGLLQARTTKQHGVES